MGKRNSIEGQLSLFPEMEQEPASEFPQPAPVKPWPAWPERLWVGTSSWSFPGWAGRVYAQRYSESKLSRQGLRAYARHPLLSAVGIDRTYYAPMTVNDYRSCAEQVPRHFRFLVKAPERLTLARFPRHPRYAALAGEENPDFLSPELARQWVEPAAQGLGANLGCLLLQFAPTSPQSVGGATGFATRLHQLLEGLPRDLPLAVEIRNREWFCAAYLQVLQRLDVSHCLTVHPTMPPLLEQFRLAGPQPLTVIRWMLGLSDYAQAVARYEPFDRLVDEDPGTRSAILSIWRESLSLQRPILTIVNNKAEGCSPLSIERLAESWWEPAAPF